MDASVYISPKRANQLQNIYFSFHFNKQIPHSLFLAFLPVDHRSDFNYTPHHFRILHSHPFVQQFNSNDLCTILLHITTTHRPYRHIAIMVAKEEFTNKKKSLSIHIDTEAQGPHGMPLVYGSTTGSIKGSVHFASNYDCKGRDIMIIYEAWTETRWTSKYSEEYPSLVSCESKRSPLTNMQIYFLILLAAFEHKRTVNHLSKNMFGHQTWSFPLIHTKAKGSTVVGGNYVQEFDIPLVSQDSISIPDSGRRSTEPIASRFTRKSRSSSSASRSSTSSISSTCPYLSSSPSSASSSTSSLHDNNPRPQSTPLPPSSNLCPESRVKYTIRAVLQRPFPSLSNFEASQEVWVINTPTSTPSVSQSLPESVSFVSSPSTPSEPTILARSFSMPIPSKPQSPESTPQAEEEKTIATSKAEKSNTMPKSVAIASTTTTTSSSSTFYLAVLALLLVAFVLNSFLSSTLTPFSSKITL